MNVLLAGGYTQLKQIALEDDLRHLPLLRTTRLSLRCSEFD